MKEFPNCISAKNIDKFDKLKENRNICYLRDDIYEFLLSMNSENLEREFYDFTKFFDKNSIKNREFYRDIIIKELKEKDWILATVFGGWGLVFGLNEESLNKSIWKSSLDFTIV